MHFASQWDYGRRAPDGSETFLSVARRRRVSRELTTGESTLRLGLAALGAAGLLAAPATAYAQVPNAPAQQVTFATDVAPIFQAKCQSCHEPGSIAPMSLVTFREARPWAKSIKSRVETRQMPPWHIDRSVGVQKFKNDMSLTDAQIATIVRWVDQGAPEGNPADFTAKPVAKGLYWRWVRMVEIRPANLAGRKVLHHSIAYHVLNPDNTAAVNTGIGVGGRALSLSGNATTPTAAAHTHRARGRWIQRALRGEGHDDGDLQRTR